MKRLMKIMAVVLAAMMIATCAFSMTSCSGGNKTKWEKDEATGLTKLMIGGIGPLSGDYANYGISVRNGAQIAIDEINANNSEGGIYGFVLTYEFQDSQGDPDSARTAYGYLMDKGMKLSLGAVLSGETAAVVDAAKDDGILVLTPSGSSVAAIAGSNQAFRVCFSDPAQGSASADYIAEYGLATKVAAFYDSSNDYCVGLYNTFENECKVKNIEIVAKQTFTKDSNTDFSTQINAIKDSGAELVFLPIYAAEAATFLTQAKGKLDGMVCFGCDGLDGLLTKVDDASTVEGVMMLSPFSADSDKANVVNFVTKYKAKYGTTPDQFAADGYDAIYTFMAALKKAGITSEDTENFNKRVVDAMTQITVEGVTGTMTWAKDGNPTKIATAMVFRSGAAVEYKPAA